MASANITMRVDENLKAQLQELMSNLGLDMTTFFTMAAKQAIREQALPFRPELKPTMYTMDTYRLAMKSTNYSSNGLATISADDDWASETEWDDLYQDILRERGI